MTMMILKTGDPTDFYTATYDAWNRLVKLEEDDGQSGLQTVQENSYDGRNYRITRKDYDAGSLAETRHYYYSAAWQVLEERLGSSPETADPDRQFLWGLRYIDDLVCRDRDTTDNGELDERLYPLQDANWNVTAIIDEEGEVQERYAYTPYGQSLFLNASFVPQSASSFEFETLYAGYRWDHSVGLYQVRHRALHPVLGTWMQRDPLGYVDGGSLYAAYFVPNGRDPFGLLDCECIGKCDGLANFAPTLNKYINDQIALARKEPGRADHNLWNRLAQDEPGFAGKNTPTTKIENWINTHVGKGAVAAGVWKYKFVRLADCMKLDCNKKSLCVGSDKIGHFFQQGYMLFEIRHAKDEEYAEGFSRWTEGLVGRTKRSDPDFSHVYNWLQTETFTFYPNAKPSKLSDYRSKWGGTVRVYPFGEQFGYIAQRSTADLEANRQGMGFWRSFPDEAPFDICKYVTPEWEE